MAQHVIAAADFGRILAAISADDGEQRKLGSSWVGDVATALDADQASTFAAALARAASTERRTELQESLLHAILDLIEVHDIAADTLAPVFTIPPESLNEENAGYVDELREYLDAMAGDVE